MNITRTNNNSVNQSYYNTSIIGSFIGEIIECLKNNNIEKSIKTFKCLMNLPAVKNQGEENIKAQIAESILVFLKESIVNLYVEEVERFGSFLIEYVKNSKTYSNINQMKFILVSNECRSKKEDRFELAAKYCEIILSQFEKKLTICDKAAHTLNYARYLFEAGKFSDSKTVHEELFKLYHSNDVIPDMPILSEIVIRNFIVCTMVCDSFPVLESILKSLIGRKQLDIKELEEVVSSLLWEEGRKENYHNCIKLDMCLKSVNIYTSSEIQLLVLTAYVQLDQYAEAIVFAKSLLSLFQKEKVTQYLAHFNIGLAHFYLAEIPEAYKAFLKAFDISPQCESIFYICSCCLDKSVNKPGVIRSKVIPVLKKNNEQKNEQLIKLLEINYDLYMGLTDTSIISTLDKIIVANKLEDEVLKFAFYIFAKACNAHARDRELIEFFNKFKEKINSNIFYRNVLGALIRIENFEDATQLINDMEKESLANKKNLFIETKNLVVATFFAIKDYEKVYSILDEYLIMSRRLRIVDIEQLIDISNHTDISPILVKLEASVHNKSQITLIKVIKDGSGQLKRTFSDNF